MGTLGFLIVLSLALGVAAWLLFVWSVRSGQYEDPEGPKYRMLEDDEPAPPGSEGQAPPGAEEREGDGSPERPPDHKVDR